MRQVHTGAYRSRWAATRTTMRARLDPTFVSLLREVGYARMVSLSDVGSRRPNMAQRSALGGRGGSVSRSDDRLVWTASAASRSYPGRG